MQFYHGNKPPDVQGSNLHFNILTLKGLPFSGGTIELRKKNSVMVNQNTYSWNPETKAAVMFSHHVLLDAYC